MANQDVDQHECFKTKEHELLEKKNHTSFQSTTAPVLAQRWEVKKTNSLYEDAFESIGRLIALL